MITRSPAAALAPVSFWFGIVFPEAAEARFSHCSIADANEGRQGRPQPRDGWKLGIRLSQQTDA